MEDKVRSGDCQWIMEGDGDATGDAAIVGAGVGSSSEGAAFLSQAVKNITTAKINQKEASILGFITSAREIFQIQQRYFVLLTYVFKKGYTENISLSYHYIQR